MYCFYLFLKYLNNKLFSIIQNFEYEYNLKINFLKYRVIYFCRLRILLVKNQQAINWLKYIIINIIFYNNLKKCFSCNNLKCLFCNMYYLNHILFIVQINMFPSYITVIINIFKIIWVHLDKLLCLIKICFQKIL